MASLKTNVLLNYLNTFSSIVFPVITFPYATRVLQLEGIGLANFYGSLINYITLFSGIGIQMYASKEVAKYRDNIYLRNKCTVEIEILGLFFCFCGYVAVALLSTFIPSIHAHRDMFYVLSLSIFFTAIGMDWFYRAIEAFTFITVRAVIFRVITAAMLFIFVHSPQDLLIYCVTMVSLSVGNNVINFIHIRKYITISSIPWKQLNVWHHLPQTLRIFIPNLVTNMYGHLNIVMLGFMQTSAIVGLYSAGSKLVLIVLTVITSLSIVLLPRSSNLIQTGHTLEFRAISLKSIHLVLFLSLPCMMAMILLSSQIVTIFCGEAFAEASVVVAYSAPILLLVGLSNIIGIQVLYSQGKEKIVVGSLVVGVIINFICNLLLIPAFHYKGASLSMIVAEFSVLFIQIMVSRAYIPFKFSDIKATNYLLGTFFMCVAMFLIKYCTDNLWISTITSTIIGIVVYTLTLYVRKDSLFMEALCYVSSIAKHFKSFHS